MLILSDVIPDEILYFFDEPIIFTKVVGSLKLLCQKIDDDDLSSLFIMAPVSDQMLDAVKHGRISLRSPFIYSYCWFVKESYDSSSILTWTVHGASIPDDLLPEAGIALGRPGAKVADIHVAIPIEPPFLSLSFSGRKLRDGTMPFGTFKSLVDNCYSTLRDVFLSNISGTTKGSVPGASLIKMLEIPIRQPTFSSLSLEIDMPNVDLKRLVKKVSVDEGLINENLTTTGSTLIRKIEELADAAEHNQIVAGNVLDIDFISAVVDIMPSDQGDIESLTVTSVDPTGNERSVNIDQIIGGRIVDANRRINRSNLERVGHVVEINYGQRTFIMQSFTGKQITCRFKRVEGVDAAISRLSKGMELAVFGNNRKRPRRDLMFVRHIRNNLTRETLYEVI